MLKENVHLSNPTHLLHFKETLKVIFKHCLNVLIENVHLSNPTHLLHLSGDIKDNI